jgi:hypothetical protein
LSETTGPETQFLPYIAFSDLQRRRTTALVEGLLFFVVARQLPEERTSRS